MKRVWQAIAVLIVLSILVTGLYGVWSIGSWIASMDPKLAGPTVTAALGFVGLLYAQWHSKTRDIDQSHRPQKIEVYEGFFKIMEQFLKDPNAQKELEEGQIPDELRDQFWNLNQGLIVWASPPVIQAWLKFRRISGAGENSMYAMDELLKAMRKDLGNSNFGLQRGDTVRVFLSDPDELE